MGRWIKRAVMASVGTWLWRKGKEAYAAKQEERRRKDMSRWRHPIASRGSR